MKTDAQIGELTAELHGMLESKDFEIKRVTVDKVTKAREGEIIIQFVVTESEDNGKD